MPEQVRCKDCGFVALRHRVTREICEVEDGTRRTGINPLDTENQEFLVYEPYLICFRRAFPLRDEQLPSDRDPKIRLEVLTLKVLETPRTCGSFIKLEQGFSPREHWDMLQEAERLKWQEQRDVADRAERDKREHEAREFQSKQAKLNRRHQWLTLAVSMAGLAVAVYSAFKAKAPQPITVQVDQPAASVPAD